MSVTIRIPTLLRSATGGRSQVMAEGTTVAEVFRAVDVEHPGFAAAVLETDGSIKRFLSVFVGDDDARYLQGANTVVADGSEVVILPAIAGGGGRP